MTIALGMLLGAFGGVTGTAAQAAGAGALEPVVAGAAAMRSVPRAGGAPQSLSPVLHTMLPDDALAYLRVPNAWGVLGAPKGAALDGALQSQAYADAVRGIRAGFGSNVLPLIPDDVRHLWQLLLFHSRSPLEAFLLPPENPAIPIPRIVISGAMDFPDAGAVNEFLAGAASSGPNLQVAQPLNADGMGAVFVGGLPVHVSYADSRLDLLISGTPAIGGARTLIEALPANPDHPMRATESAIDGSGQGLFGWVNPAGLLRFMEAAGQTAQIADLVAAGFDHMDALAFGMGTSGGIHRLKLVADMPNVGFREMIPVAATSMTLETAGPPRFAALLGLPGAAEFTRIEAAILADMSAEANETYLQDKRELVERLGFSPEALLQAIGPEIGLVGDEAGRYVAVRLRDARAFDDIVSRLTDRLDLAYERREVAGHTYHHLVIPTGETPVSPDDPAELAGYMAMRLLTLPSHLYWTRDGDYLLFASVPQTLIDRTYVRERVGLADWLRREQRVDPDAALALATLRSEGAPGFLYDLNLQILLALGDFVGRPPDLFALPSARELRLPAEGAYSFKMTSSPSQLAVEIDFENNPLEILLAGPGGSMAATAMIGILAAVALPAYQDYVTMAEEAARASGRAPPQ